MESVLCSFTFSGSLPSHWAETRRTTTIGMVWWPWQRRREVIKMILTHYFKQTERAPMRGIKERERKFGKGAWDVAQKRLLFSAGETIQQGRNLVMTVRRLTTKNICEHVVFNIHMHIFLCHTPDLWKLLQACVWCSSHPFIQTGWATRQDMTQTGLRPSPGPSFSSACWKPEHSHVRLQDALHVVKDILNDVSTEEE